MSRPSWDEYFLRLCEEVAKRATCNRGRNSCVIVKDKRIVCTGYVGSPPNFPHCDEVGHLLKKVIHEDGTITQHCMRTVHAELNAILQAARFGIPLEGSTMYVRMTPCRNCAMAIISAGIKRVVCEKHYHAEKESIELFAQAGVEFTVLKDEVVKYEE